MRSSPHYKGCVSARRGFSGQGMQWEQIKSRSKRGGDAQKVSRLQLGKHTRARSRTHTEKSLIVLQSTSAAMKAATFPVSESQAVTLRRINRSRAVPRKEYFSVEMWFALDVEPKYFAKSDGLPPFILLLVSQNYPY